MIEVTFSRPPEKWRWVDGWSYRAVARKDKQEIATFLASREQFPQFIDKAKKLWKTEDVVVSYQDHIPPLKEYSLSE